MNNKTLPIYKKIAEELLKDIKSGSLAGGERLPTEYELAETFQVSRLTIRKAIDYLIARNVLIKQKNHGTYVVEQSKIQSGAMGLAGFSESIRNLGMTPTTKLIEMNEIYLPEQDIVERLQLEKNESVIYIKRVRYANDEPLVIENLHIPKKFLGDINSIDFENDSIFEVIEKQILIGYSQQEVSAELVSRTSSELLEIEHRSPILLVNTTTYSVQGGPILIDNSYYRSDKYIFKNILQRNQ
ncbi:GntR family transcriptional regulator [Vagococcus coleopterorum]|uniref:GntR family transcriptional regulator n=1 Tax=Vagococcus coleopterorum TaxID=2714946 RepID=A0A6G8ANU6_9ENTE|nr:GntR family transcriptional regulator, LSA1692 subfamily [Vagococcus coleopterorum]QIL46754.1 GntR family transcriptional regulator [Vagococcus coleopterorum]